MEQIPLCVLQQVGPPRFLSAAVVARIRTEEEAVAWCWAHRRIKAMTVTEAARHLGMPKSHLSNILAGKKYLPFGVRVQLQLLCGNWLIRQWEDRHCGFVTLEETPDQRRIRELEAKVQELEMAA